MSNGQKTRKFILWGGWYGSRNIGDRLLLITITDMLYERYKNCKFTILSAQPEIVKEYFFNLNSQVIKVIKPKAQFLELISEIITCDLIILGGGVPFFDQIKQAINMLVITSISRILRKPYLLWCVSSFQIKNRFNQLAFRIVINNAVETTCRDNYSKEIFKSFHIKKVPEIVQDPAFSMVSFDYTEANRLLSKYAPGFENKKLFALTPRTLRTKDSEAQTHYNVKTPVEIQHQLEVYSLAIIWLIENGFTPVFFPMNTNPPDDDRIAAWEIIEKSKFKDQLRMIDEVILPRAAPALFSKCEGSLVSRVHGSVSSFLGECPPIMYAFEKKHAGVMESMGLEKLIFEVDQDPQNIVKMLKYLEKNKRSIKDKIIRDKPILENNSRAPMDLILKLFN